MQLLMRALMLLAFVLPACAQDAFTLRFRPQPQALKYRSHEVSVNVAMRAGEPARTTSTERGALELYRIKSAGPNLVELAVDTLNVTFSRDGVIAPAPTREPVRVQVTPRGYSLDQGKEIVPSPLSLILPEQELKLGHPVFGVRGLASRTYTVNAVASPPTPVPVPVQTKVAGLVTHGDRPCVRIETSARVSEKLNNGTRLYEYVLLGWYIFDPALGTVVESRVEERVDDAVLPVPKTGLLRKRRETVRTARLER